MLHPSPVAVKYIWDKLQEVYVGVCEGVERERRKRERERERERERDAVYIYMYVCACVRVRDTHTHTHIHTYIVHRLPRDSANAAADRSRGSRRAASAL